MLFLAHISHILIYLIAIIFCCHLFTNAIEHLGEKLKLGQSATGSILAVVGTTLPETVVPIVAIFSAMFLNSPLEINSKIALGAIIGSPFMLSCLALFLLGLVLVFKKREFLELKEGNILRNYRYFLFAYPFAIGLSFLPSRKLKLLGALALVVLYVFFVYRTIIKSKESYIEAQTDELIFIKILTKCPHKAKFDTFFILLQVIISIMGLVVFSHLFLKGIAWFSETLNISPLVLSLIVTPFATELPECANSILWLFEDKDELALANVLGAIVFQASVLAAIGIVLTSWNLDRTIILNAIFVMVSSLIFVISAKTKGKISYRSLLLCGFFYFGFFAIIFFK